MEQGKTNVVDQAFFVDEKPGYATKDIHLNEVRQTLYKKNTYKRESCPPLIINSIVW